MRVVRFRQSGQSGLALESGERLRGLLDRDLGGANRLSEAIAAQDLAGLEAQLERAPEIDPAGITYLPPIERPGKIICVGLNYADHTSESPYEQPDYPTLFPRFSTSLIGHDQPIVRPSFSDTLDYEGELVAVIGKGGHSIPKAQANDHVIGYSVFNDGSVREYQFKSPQWTVGKNFDATGGFGPSFVSADELPAGGKGLRLQTRLNGRVVQDANTDDMIYQIADIISIVSQAITLEPGDVIVSGTPAGIGWAREPKLLMRPGDVCEVEIEGVGTLRNPIASDGKTA